MKVFRSSFRVLSLAGAFAFLQAVHAGTNVIVWDTTSQAKGTVSLSNRATWKLVPTDLFQLEKEPAKASSDPGYYGREYRFNGDVVVENRSLTAAFSVGGRSISVFGKSGAPILEIQSLQAAPLQTFELMRNDGDEVVLDVVFGRASDGQALQNDPRLGVSRTRFTFGKNEIIEIAPQSRFQGLKIISPIEYAVVPGFVADDLIFGEVEDASGDSLAVPNEDLLMGLLKGEGRALVMTWPEGKQRIQLNLGAEKDKKRSIESIEINADERPIYLSVSSAPGIWHREFLDASFLEKDKAINWKPPFSAKWQTQLVEGGTKATYPFRQHKGTVWRGVPGSYDYPVWFDGTTAFYHLSKKVPPKGESIIYFLEGNDTPSDVLTPVDMLKSTLGRVAAEPILDVTGRKLRTHHGSSGSGVHRACTCGYTEAIQAVFEKGEEVDRKSFVGESISDMIYFVQRHLERIDEYREFAKELTSLMQNRAKQNPELKLYLDEIDQLAQQIPQEYENQKENMKSLAYAGELSKQTLALCGTKDANNLKTYMELLKAWRGMGGAQDYVVAQYHTLTRNLFQQAGYLAAAEPKAIDIAQEIRARCKKVLRNPDGYEIWPNF